MSDVVIRAEGLGKRYLIGHRAQAERYAALRDVVVRNAKGVVRSARDMLHGRQIVAGDETEEFWALKDVNFEINRGDVVGIIGRNGAGKSTLLKILSRITEPSTGRVEIKGRVASLLEVGTGFHPELSGRENIFLNGAILGMTRAEIKRKFDEIVAFASVERFLDTPVKHYSSGMYVRLAFAVAAHLEPEILIVDEVLAVGDTEFQNKCLGKINAVANNGRTVLFVSHNLSSIQSLCKTGIHLSSGAVKFIGRAENAIAHYQSNTGSNNNESSVATLSHSVTISACTKVVHAITGTRALFEADIHCKISVTIYSMRLIINSASGVRVAVLDAIESMLLPRKLEDGVTNVSFTIDNLNLVEGSYSIVLSIEMNDTQRNFEDFIFLLVTNPPEMLSTGVPAEWRGVVDLRPRIMLNKNF